MKLYAVVRYWISLVAGGARVQGRGERDIQYCAAFFYMDYGLVASTDPVWLHGAFVNLTKLFNRVGIWANVGKTVGMIFFP